MVDTVASAKDAYAAPGASNPPYEFPIDVARVAPARLTLQRAFEKGGAVSINAVAHTDQVPPTAARPSDVAFGVVLAKTPPEIGGLADVGLSRSGKQKIDGEPGEPLHSSPGYHRRGGTSAFPATGSVVLRTSGALSRLPGVESGR